MSTDEHQIKCAVSFIKASCCLLNASLRRFVPLVFFPAEIEAEYHDTT